MEDAARTESDRYFTPPEVARRYGVAPETVRAWIAAGELDAIDVSDRSTSRPRYRISREALAAFERRRAAVAKPKTTRRRRRRPGVEDGYARRYL